MLAGLLSGGAGNRRLSHANQSSYAGLCTRLPVTLAIHLFNGNHLLPAAAVAQPIRQFAGSCKAVQGQSPQHRGHARDRRQLHLQRPRPAGSWRVLASQPRCVSPRRPAHEVNHHPELGLLGVSQALRLSNGS